MIVRPLRNLLIFSFSLIALALGNNHLIQAQELSKLESKFLSDVRQVTNGFVKAGEGYFSPDGKQIVYQAVRQEYPFYQIFTQPLEGGIPRLISTGRGRTTCSYFSPDGKRLLFASSHLDPKIDETEAAELKQQEEDRKSGKRRRYSWPFDPHTDIFEADLQGNLLRRLTTEAGYDAEGAYSYDGKKIAFCSTRDGDPDLYVANDYGANQLYRNDLGEGGNRTFTEIAAMVGVEDKGAGMSASWGDFNRDGLPDLYVGNMYSNAGSRITSQPDFPMAQDHGLLAIYRRFAKGNTLLSQAEPNQFSEQDGVAAMGRWAWSSVFADLDNDGWEDLFVANGYITSTEPEDL